MCLNYYNHSWIGPLVILFLQLQFLSPNLLKGPLLATPSCLELLASVLCLWHWHLMQWPPIGNVQGRFPWEGVILCLFAPAAASPCPLSFSGVPRCGTLAPPLNEGAFPRVDHDFRQASSWPLLLPHLFLSVAFKTADLPPRELLLPWFEAACVLGRPLAIPSLYLVLSAPPPAAVTRQVGAPVLSSAPPSHAHGSMLV